MTTRNIVVVVVVAVVVVVVVVVFLHIGMAKMNDEERPQNW